MNTEGHSEAASAEASTDRDELVSALKEAQRAINSMKAEAENAGAHGDEQMLREACEAISNEGCAADDAIRAILASAPISPRDYFAAKAMQGLLSDSETLKSFSRVSEGRSVDTAVSRRCYELADAMLKARNA